MRHLVIPALAVAGLLAAGAPALAQHGGGRSGGAFYGGGHGGFSGGHSGFSGGHYGGYHGGYGGYHGGHYGYYPGFGLSIGLGYPGYYGGYGYGYGGDVYPSYYGDSGYGYAPAYSGGQMQSAYAPAYQPATLAATQAKVIVRMPANATLWVDDYQSQQTGAVRELITPATLEPGKTYHYTLKAQWTENGQTVTKERTVNFQAGQPVVVDMAQPEQGPPPAASPAPPAPTTPPATTPPAPPATTPPAP